MSNSPNSILAETLTTIVTTSHATNKLPNDMLEKSASQIDRTVARSVCFIHRATNSVQVRVSTKIYEGFPLIPLSVVESLSER